MKKVVNVIDSKTGAPLRDPKTRRLLTREVEMTPAEIEAFEAERAALREAAEQKGGGQ